MLDALEALLADHLTLPLPWPWAIGGAAALVAVLELLNRQLFRWLARLVGRTETTLDDLLVKQMRWPAQGLVFLLGLHALFMLRGGQSATGGKVVTIVELMLVAYLAIETAEAVVIHHWLAERRKVQVPSVVRHLILVLLYLGAFLSIVGGVTGVDVLPILATSTVITAVIGLALQDTLGNLFAGLALSLEKPFAEGDWILVDGIEGRVEHVGWRATHLRTFSRDLLVLPNATLGRARLQNFDRPERLTGRNLEVPVPLHAAPEAVEAALLGAVARVPALLQGEPRPRAWFVGTTPLFHRYVMRVWTADFSTHDDAESDLMKALWHELRARGIALEAPAAAAVDAEGRPVARAP